MARRTAGTFQNFTVFGETVRAFVPAPLPPDVALRFVPSDQLLFDESAQYQPQGRPCSKLIRRGWSENGIEL